jgi:WD40 repeat protein
VATGHSEGGVSIWDGVTGKLLAQGRDGTRPLSALAFSPSGSTVVTGNLGGRIALWELPDTAH